MRAALLGFVCLAPLFAQWERYMGTPKGDSVKNQPAHPLSFFMGNACIEDDRKRNACPGYVTEATLVIVGHVGKFTVDEIDYHPSNPDQSEAQSILVESEPGVFHEVYFRVQTQMDAVINPPKLIDANGQTILLASYSIGGHPGGVVEKYFVFGPDGTRLMHLDRLREVAEKKVPKDSAMAGMYGDAQIDLAAFKCTFGVGPADPWRKSDVGSNGTIVVHFKIDQDFVPLSAEFIPARRR